MVGDGTIIVIVISQFDSNDFSSSSMSVRSESDAGYSEYGPTATCCVTLAIIDVNLNWRWLAFYATFINPKCV